MAASKHAKYIIEDLKFPMTPEAVARYAKIGKRILWVDEKVVPASNFQMNISWYLHASDTGPGAHYHDVLEIIGFVGNDPDDPYNLHGEIEMWMEDEKFILKRSCMIYVPAKMIHCPLILRRVGRPIFHFTTVTAGKYEVKGMEKQS